MAKGSAGVRVRVGDALLRNFAKGRRRKLDDAAEKLLVLRTLLGTEQGIGMSEERRIDGVPVARHSDATSQAE